MVINDEAVTRSFEDPRRCAISLPLLVLSFKNPLGDRLGDDMEALLEAFALRETAYSTDFWRRGGFAC